MPLSSANTRQQVLAEYADCASYEELGDVSLAKRFMTACRLLVSPQFSVKRSSHGGRGGDEVELDLSLIKSELEQVRRWISVQPGASPVTGGGGVVLPDFSAHRGR